MTSGKRRKALLPADLQLQNGFNALEVDRWLNALSKEESVPSEPEPHSGTRRMWQVTVIGGVPSVGHRGLTCQLKGLSRKICCLPVAQFRG